MNLATRLTALERRTRPEPERDPCAHLSGADLIAFVMHARQRPGRMERLREAEDPAHPWLTDAALMEIADVFGVAPQERL